ncbi:MAG TPA: hypothetical protein VFQ22_11875 [Longimicrobiales bacterium]|nr:hypothetical protein [Longimicrobiales bacterium]
MYRRTTRPAGSVLLDLDSLMDILTCLVGVMLFMVMYTVLQLGMAAYRAEVVVSREPVAAAQRVVVVAAHGTVRVLDTRSAVDALLEGFEIVRSPAEVQLFVDGLERPHTDPFFSYSLAYTERSTADILEMLDLVIDERPGAPGDSIQQLDEGSAYARALERLDPETTWLSFAVDEESVDVFRRARELAIARGFATGFDLLSIDFPLTVALSREGLDDLLSPLATLSKPLRR